MKTGLITTLNTNIGDDFIRMGIQRILQSLNPKDRIEWVPINKHKPETVWPRLHPKRRHLSLPTPFNNLVGHTLKNRFESCDLIVQCGAPVVWNGCSQCEWNGPLWQDVIAPLSSSVPVINLAAGSAYPLSVQSEQLEGDDLKYIQSILGYCRLTTARDRLAQRLMQSAGTPVPLIPCSACLALDPLDGEIASRRTIAVNYMPKAGHFDFLNELDEHDWARTFRSVLTALKNQYHVVFLCHNASEYQQAKALFPDFPAILPRSRRAYNRFASGVRFGVFNRLHAAVAFAGIGIPSVVVGNDTRTLMVEEFGLDVFDVRQIASEQILEAIARINAHIDEESRRLLTLRNKTLADYSERIAAVC